MIAHWSTRLLVIVFAFALLIVALLGIPQQAGAAPPKPCIGAVVRADIAGVEIVRRSNGTICSRPAGGKPIAPRKVGK